MSSDQQQRCIAEAVHATSEPKFLKAFRRPSGAITPDCQSGRPGIPDNTATDDSVCHPASLVLLRATQTYSGLCMERKYFCCIQPPRYGGGVA